MENDKIENSNATYWGDFQKLWNVGNWTSKTSKRSLHNTHQILLFFDAILCLLLCSVPKLMKFQVATRTQCLKITEKNLIQIASEASYVYILSGQEFIKNAENGRFWRLFETWSSQSQSVTIHVKKSQNS